MRSTTNYISKQSLSDVLDNLERLSRIKKQISSGKRINVPSDSPVDAAQIMSYNNRIAAENQYLKNIAGGLSDLNFSTSTLDQVGNLLMEMYDLAVQHGDGSTTSAEKAVAAVLMNSYLEELVRYSNTQLNNKYIFGGTQTLVAPFTAEYADTQITGVTQNPAGIAGTRSIEISSGESSQINVTGSEIFQPSGEGTADDVFQIVIDLRNALEDNDIDAIKQYTDSLEDAIDSVLETTAVAGERVVLLEQTRQRINDSILLYKEERSRIEDTDLVKAMVDHSIAENVYQAALMVTSKMMQYSLANFLR